MNYPKFCEECYAVENTGNIIQYYYIENKIKLLCSLCVYKYKTKEVKYENNSWWKYVNDFNE